MLSIGENTNQKITWEAINDANNIINNDPFTMNDVLESRWIKEWMPE
jgi:uncharacterized protein YciI